MYECTNVRTALLLLYAYTLALLFTNERMYECTNARTALLLLYADIFPLRCTNVRIHEYMNVRMYEMRYSCFMLIRLLYA